MDLIGAYIFMWAVLIYVSASTWHLWRYLNGGDSHAVIAAKAIHIALAAFIGAMVGFWVTGFLLVIGYLLDSLIGLTEFGLDRALGTTGLMIVFFACAQVSACFFLLKDDESWRKFLKSSEQGDQNHF